MGCGSSTKNKPEEKGKQPQEVEEQPQEAEEQSASETSKQEHRSPEHSGHLESDGLLAGSAKVETTNAGDAAAPAKSQSREAAQASQAPCNAVHVVHVVPPQQTPSTSWRPSDLLRGVQKPAASSKETDSKETGNAASSKREVHAPLMTPSPVPGAWKNPGSPEAEEETLRSDPESGLGRPARWVISGICVAVLLICASNLPMAAARSLQGAKETTTTTMLMTTIHGAFNLVASGATSAQVVAAAKAALANQFQVAQSQVMVTATQSNRATKSRRLDQSGNWLVQYTVIIPQSQVQTSQKRLNTISSNSSSFSDSLTAELSNAGVKSASLANFETTHFAGSLPTTTTTRQGATTATTTIQATTATIKIQERTSTTTRRKEASRRGTGKASRRRSPGQRGSGRRKRSSECVSYKAAKACEWTQKWSCPGQQRGRLGEAANDNSIGYRCCCGHGMWKHSRLYAKRVAKSKVLPSKKSHSNATENEEGSNALHQSDRQAKKYLRPSARKADKSTTMTSLRSHYFQSTTAQSKRTQQDRAKVNHTSRSTNRSIDQISADSSANDTDVFNTTTTFRTHTDEMAVAPLETLPVAMARLRASPLATSTTRRLSTYPPTTTANTRTTAEIHQVHYRGTRYPTSQGTKETAIFQLNVPGASLRGEGHANDSARQQLVASAMATDTSIYGTTFTYQNYYSTMAAQLAVGLWSDTMSAWYATLTKGDSSVGVGPGPNTTSYYAWDTVRSKLQEISKKERAGNLERSNEIGVQIMNNIMWPETQTISLGYNKTSHDLVRPYLAKAFDGSRGQSNASCDGSSCWNLNYFRQIFKDRFLTLNTMTSDDLKWLITIPLHRIAADTNLTDLEAQEFSSYMHEFSAPTAFPQGIAETQTFANTMAIDSKLASKARYLTRLEEGVQRKWPDLVGGKLTLVASAMLDTLLMTGGLPVPTVLETMLALFHTKTRLPALNVIDLGDNATLYNFMYEAMRRYPPVAGVPAWVRKGNGHPWAHEIPVLAEALQDPVYFPDPSKFVLGRPGLNANDLNLSIGWADFALDDGDFQKKGSRSCPGKELSQQLIIAFMKEFLDAGPWIPAVPDIHVNSYRTSGFTLCKNSAMSECLKSRKRKFLWWELILVISLTSSCVCFVCCVSFVMMCRAKDPLSRASRETSKNSYVRENDEARGMLDENGIVHNEVVASYDDPREISLSRSYESRNSGNRAGMFQYECQFSRVAMESFLPNQILIDPNQS